MNAHPQSLASQPSTPMSGADIVLAALAEHGVTHIFGFPGGATLPLYDALLNQSGIRHISARHEQGAVHAAEGYAKASGKTGVALVTSGPGATNTITGLMNAYADSTPLVVITGQVPSTLIGTRAFQECAISEIARPCTKKSTTVLDVNDLASVLHEAFHLARSGRPGPVLVDLPKDVQTALGLYTDAPSPESRTTPPAPDQAVIDTIARMMATARRPVLYTGGGLIAAGPSASQSLAELVRQTGFPVTSTLMGLGAFPATNAEWLGMLGMHGTVQANTAMHQADLILALGARFDDRVTGVLQGFAPHATIVHVDIDPKAMGRTVRADIEVLSDCALFLSLLIPAWKKAKGTWSKTRLAPWVQQIEALRAREEKMGPQPQTAITPRFAFRCLAANPTCHEAIITTDVGQHQMWAAQYFPFTRSRQLITSGGLGTMGFGLPAAIGAQLANPHAPVVCFSGDGSIQMTVQEMATVREYDLPIKLIVFNNERLGMVHQWQALFYDNRFSCTEPGFQPDFVKLAKAYGWKGVRCETPKAFAAAAQELMASRAPMLVDCRVPASARCYPMIPPGKAHHEMMFGG